jgi:hypothetical protein
MKACRRRPDDNIKEKISENSCARETNKIKFFFACRLETPNKESCSDRNKKYSYENHCKNLISGGKILK